MQPSDANCKIRCVRLLIHPIRVVFRNVLKNFASKLPELYAKFAAVFALNNICCFVRKGTTHCSCFWFADTTVSMAGIRNVFGRSFEFKRDEKTGWNDVYELVQKYANLAIARPYGFYNLLELRFPCGFHEIHDLFHLNTF